MINSRSKTNEDMKVSEKGNYQPKSMRTNTDRGEYRVATTENEDGYGINEVHYDECDPAIKGSMIQPSSPTSNQGPNFLPDLRIEDLNSVHEP